MATATASTSVRDRVKAASARIKRVKAIDRAATALITFGGIFIIINVLFIFLFVFGEAWPLFRPAEGESLGVLALAPVREPAWEASGAAAPAAAASAAGAAAHAQGQAKPLVIGTDEYQMYLYELLPDGRFLFFRAQDGSLAREIPVPSLAGVRLTIASRTAAGHFVAAGTDDGRVALLQLRFRPRYEEQRLVDLDFEVRERGLLEIDPQHRPVREVDYLEQEAWRAVAALVGDDEIAYARQNADEGADRRETLRTPGEQVLHVRLGHTDTLAAATRQGDLLFWELEQEAPLPELVRASAQAVTALEFALGGGSLLVGDAAGKLSAWFRVRADEREQRLSLVRAHEYASQGTAIRAIGISTRDRSFVSAGADGSLVVRHMTSDRTIVSFPAGGPPAERAIFTPRADGLLALRQDGSLARYRIANPHPEVSWRALFGKVWYEGYAEPEYVWQSTGANDEFEPKLSLVPLVFGTIKGTLYALLFAVPIAILAALYTSQFAHPNLRQRVKPVVEVMAALPSVVIGFIGGLWLAGKVEASLVPVLLLVVLLPAFGTAGVLAWDRLPRGLLKRLMPGTELALILPLLLLGGWVSVLLGPSVERVAFGGDVKAWLHDTLGLVYDQRNCIVVGLAMGFAVIPIIFTISEDAFSSVPSHLTAASLALGASRWQTAVRVVLPTASPGIFSAVMVGFGRAVGETMIVLMATGNTPVLDWSVFNGMRTLSATIAVETPEAPHGGTLYRVLFLAAGVLFVMTFVVNTVAELVRQRLRDKYKAI